MVQFVSTRIPNFLLQSCFKWVTATRVVWFFKLLGMRAACILTFSTSSPVAARPTIPSGLGSGDGRVCTGCRKVSLGRHPGAGRPHCACSLQRGRGSSSRSAVPAAPRPLRAAGCRSGRASGVSTHSHGASASGARSPRPPPGTGEGQRSDRPGTEGLGGGRGPPGDLPPCAWNVLTWPWNKGSEATGRPTFWRAFGFAANTPPLTPQSVKLGRGGSEMNNSLVYRRHTFSCSDNYENFGSKTRGWSHVLSQSKWSPDCCRSLLLTSCK